MAKRIFFTILSCVAATLLTAQNHSFDIGDDIYGFVENDPPQYTISKEFLLDAPDGSFELKGYKEDADKEDSKFFFANGHLVGVTQYEKGQELFLYDMSGNGKIQIVSQQPFIPAWILSISKYTKKTSTNNIDAILNGFYDIFNGSDNPYESSKSKQLMTEAFELAKNINTENRDIIYGIFLYYHSIQQQTNPYLNYANMQMVLTAYLGRFKPETAHPLILLWEVKENIGIRNNEYVIEMLPTLINKFPEFVPFKVYAWQLEKDPKLKEEKYKELKKKYPKHWFVKQI